MPSIAPSRPRLVHALVFVCFGVSGAAALVYEVTWTRTLTPVMGSSTYALSTMLAAFMAGLSLGGLAGAVASERFRNLAAVFALCELGIGALGFLVNPAIRALTPLYISTWFELHTSFAEFSIAQFVLALLVMGAPTFLMGVTFPVAVKLFSARRDEPGRAAGRLYAVNTLGGIVGSLSAGFLLVPAIGVSRTAGLAAAVQVTGAIALLALSLGAGRALAGAALAVLAAGGAARLDGGEVPTFGYAWARRFGSPELARRVAADAGAARVLFHEEGVEGDVWVIGQEGRAGAGTTLVNGGKLEAGDDASFGLLGELPYFTARLIGPVRTVLSIGLGSGRTLRHLVRLPVESVESVELNPAVVDANRLRLSPELFSDARIRHVVADGRHLLLMERHPFDVVAVSPSWATDLASAGMLTDEFFTLLAQRLTPGGVAGVWVDWSMMADADMSRLLRTFARSFRHVSVWKVPSGDAVLVGSNASRYPAESAVQALALGANPEAKGGLALGLGDAAPRPAVFRDLNTDDHPVLEFDNARAYVSGAWAMAPPGAPPEDRAP